MIGTILLILIAGFIISFLFIYRNRQLRHSKEKQELYRRFHEELLTTKLEIQEQTLKNISQEIHDNIGQTLSLVKLNLNTIDIQKQNLLQDKIYNSKELVSKAIHDLRNLSKSLSTDSILSEGLIQTIKTELTIVENAGVFQTDMKITGSPITLDPKKEMILFRIVQEAINNIIKHSNADNIFISADFTGEILRIDIKDNGQGFDPQLKSEGSGLKNMNNRAHLIEGKVNVYSTTQGTTITVTVPTQEI